jgi:MoaA/NifB/PqqE/SkfB family radical SAM enzyme
MSLIEERRYFINRLRLRLELYRALFTLYAKIFKKRFYCRSLAGESCYNLTINSDFTVSCNCNDFYGLGKIGNLKEQNLKEILLGEKADNFKKLLSRGIPPIINCIVCPGLCLVNKKNNKNIFKMPKVIRIENTIDCNLHCLSCLRKKLGSLRDKRKMSLEDIEKIALEIKRNKIETVFYFNLGEPFFSKDIEKELKIIRKQNPRVRIIISTNGMLLDSESKKRAALLLDEIIFGFFLFKDSLSFTSSTRLE